MRSPTICGRRSVTRLVPYVNLLPTRSHERIRLLHVELDVTRVSSNEQKCNTKAVHARLEAWGKEENEVICNEDQLKSWRNMELGRMRDLKKLRKMIFE